PEPGAGERGNQAHEGGAPGECLRPALDAGESRHRDRLEAGVGQRLEEAEVGNEKGVAPVVGKAEMPGQVERDAEGDELLEPDAGDPPGSPTPEPARGLLLLRRHHRVRAQRPATAPAGSRARGWRTSLTRGVLGGAP